MTMDDRGQATVEAAMTLPVVLIALLLIVQVGVVVRDAMSLVQAAREGARTAAVTGDDILATRTALDADGSLSDERVVVDIQPPSGERARGGEVTVHLSYADKLTIPIVSRLVSFDVPLRSTATMRIEQTPPTPSPAPSA
jgi:hypothetical protein